MECRKSMQVAVNGIITLPDYIPDIDFILRVTSTPVIENAIVIDKQISFSGHVLIAVEMVSSKADCPQTVHFYSYKTPFIGLLDHWCARTNMDVQLSASIKHQEFELLTPKCINKLIVIKISLLRLIKSCKPVNAHCCEPRLTLLCKTIPPTIHPSVQPIFLDPIEAIEPLEPIDFDTEPINFHLPQKIETCNAEHNEDESCSICGCKMDHT